MKGKRTRLAENVLQVAFFIVLMIMDDAYPFMLMRNSSLVLVISMRFMRNSIASIEVMSAI